MSKYRKRPVVVEATQWTGDNAAELTEWTGGAFSEIDPEDRGDNPDATAELYVDANGVRVSIEPGEWIIRDARGFYPCKPDIFADTYEPAEAAGDDRGGASSGAHSNRIMEPPPRNELSDILDRIGSEAAEQSFEERHTLTAATSCRSCSRPVAWLLTPAGKRMPVDPVPTNDGNLVVEDATATALPADALAELDVQTPRYTSHFATCPDADGWRSKGGAR